MSSDPNDPPRRETLLVVDDDDHCLETVASILEEGGFPVLRASSGFKAVEVLARERVDVILTDVVMKGMSGFEVVLHAMKADPDAICIVMTSFGSLDSAIHALQCGAYSYLQKPCDPNELRHVVHRGIEKQRLTRELRRRNAELEALNRDLDAKVRESTRELQALNKRILTEMAGVKELDQLKSSFLDSITHDLRNPLTSMVAAVGFLREICPPDFPEQGKSALEIANRAGTHLQYLMRQLVEAARLRSGKVTLELAQVQLADLLDDAMALTLEDPRDGGPKVGLYPPATTDLILRTDRGRVLQVIGNLLGNARKFTPKDGRVTLRVSLEGRDLHWSVEDTGPGIPPEHLTHIFERFFQVKGSGLEASPAKGLGLGLSIAKDLVTLLGGRIWAVSEPGKGSEFHFTLPVSGPPQ